MHPKSTWKLRQKVSFAGTKHAPHKYGRSGRRSALDHRCRNVATYAKAAELRYIRSMLVISYSSRDLADQCNRLELAQERLGPADAQALVDLIADAEAMENVLALMDFYEIEDPQADGFTIEFSPRYGAVLQPIGQKIQRNEAGHPVWQMLRRLMLVEVREL